MKKIKIDPVAKQVGWIALTAIILLLFIIIVKEMLIPIIINVCRWFLLQLELYFLLDNDIAKFFGGFIFLFIYWKVLVAIIYALEILYNGIIKCWGNADLK